MIPRSKCQRQGQNMWQPLVGTCALPGQLSVQINKLPWYSLAYLSRKARSIWSSIGFMR
jgi:hypothetical protein